MPITIEELKRLAKATMLEIKEEEYDLYLDLINNDIKTMQEVLKIDTEGVEGLINPYDMVLEQHSDVVTEKDNSDKLMKNAPQSLHKYFIVPKIINK